MSIVVSIALVALGALLWFALGWNEVGLGLMVVGGVGAVVSLVGLALSARRGRRPPAQPL